MGSVQQAVLEFDEEVQAPWRPRLVVVAEQSQPTFRAPAAHPSRRSPSRVGVCRPPVGPTVPARRPATRPGTGLTGPTSPRAAARRPAPTGAVRAARLRLTRRARRLGVVLALAVAVGVGSWLGPMLGGDGGDLRLAGVSTVVVQPGDTLWSIASSLAGEGDVRVLVDEIQHLNDLASTDLVPGQTLRLP
ncbi:LysM peptidoglycan-binding domain-containing protein [Blastococcus haudaquaticus]|uniref:LysM domain-containing protein n=1 Tax=Blastococcus haudaquaticus TaxID=1938745 RepID=A0A286H913_9ACTN|nr:LysM peptidoglycan-binding domain-containing protein [Blastococcus haudaquaticus]SOE03734.1 LysM domain-containing protein [Blastococcus haudaquaticus]